MKKFNMNRKVKGLVMVYVAVAIAGILFHVYNADWSAAGMGIVALITPWIAPLLLSWFSLSMTSEVWVLDLVFVFFASVIGSCFGGYQLPFFDKVLHFSSGLLIASAGAVLYMILAGDPMQQRKSLQRLFLFFTIFTDLAVAVLWEFFEYMMLIFFQNDCIHHYDTGVHDSITDMLCAFCAGLIVLWQFVRWMKTEKQGYFVRLCIRFYHANLKEERKDPA